MKTFLGIVIEFISIGTLTFSGNLLWLIPIYFGMHLIIDGISGNFIENSIFMVTKKKSMKFKGNTIKVDMIEGNPCRIRKTLELFLKKDKQNNFINESYNLFKQLPQTRNNKIINYGCVSHAYTYNLLKKLKDNGYIDKLDYEEKGKSRLISEELAMGKKPTFKKRKMKNIIFTLTDKKINDGDINIIKNKEEKEVKDNLIKENKVNKKIQVLKEIKKELTNISQDLQNIEQEIVKYVKKR